CFDFYFGSNLLNATPSVSYRLSLHDALPISRTATGGVLRVPGRRCVVDGELARRLDGGLRVGLVIAGCGPAPAVPVPIAVHSSSWCGGAPSCRAGATVIVVRSSSGLSEAAAESSVSG